MRTVSCSLRIARRTWCSSRGSTSSHARSRRSSTLTPRSAWWASSVRRTHAVAASAWSPSSCPDPAKESARPRSPPTARRSSSATSAPPRCGCWSNCPSRALRNWIALHCVGRPAASKTRRATEPTEQAMTEKFLRDQLVGAWELTSFIERDIATRVENHPFGKHPQGLILYTPDGYVSAQPQRPERPPVADEDLLHATPDEYAAAGRSSVAYSGLFSSVRRPNA